MAQPSFKNTFPKALAAILCIFFGVMTAVTVAAYSRPSGTTGLDMAKIQQIRQQAIERSSANDTPETQIADANPNESTN